MGYKEIAPRKESSKEIERKFLVKTFPDNLDQYPSLEIIQGYVAITNEGAEVRIRKAGNRCFLTVKRGSGEVRDEIEIKIPKKQFNLLWPATENRRLEKVRYFVPFGGQTIELDMYRGPLEGLVVAEVEFDSPEESAAFVGPQWFGRDITEEEIYKNKRLALHGLPPGVLHKREVTREELGIIEYDLVEGVAQLARLIREKLFLCEGPVIVEVAGGSASGKTSAVAAKLKEIFGEGAVILSMDDYYQGKAFMLSEKVNGHVLNWDQPEALNLPLLRQHLKELKAGRPIRKPAYSFKTGESAGLVQLNPRGVVIVEGLFALDGSVKDEGDIGAFVDIGTHGRILRRLLRDIERTGQRPVDILAYFSEVVEPMHEKYVQSTKGNADIVIRNEYSPSIEAERSGLHEVQLKFSGGIDEETLRKAGAERLGVVWQVDTYYNPRDRNLMETEEILRIREEAGHRILTYKGPKVESKMRDRPKFEFEINEETERKFLSIYGDMVKVIKKERTLYQLGGVVFTLDSVSRVENGMTSNLGKFVEIRSVRKGADEPKFDEVLSSLGLELERGIKESYFEM
ncbi:MAG: class IV adenylate cyclase [bacterium]|nr:class IV adenylate cyclase [bacterium]